MPADGTLAACSHARTSARPASKAVLKSSRFRGREEYGSASQLGQQRLRRLGRYGSPCPHLPLSGHRLGSPPPPPLRERCHCPLACRLIAVRRRAVLVVPVHARSPVPPRSSRCEGARSSGLAPASPPAEQASAREDQARTVGQRDCGA